MPLRSKSDLVRTSDSGLSDTGHNLEGARTPAPEYQLVPLSDIRASEDNARRLQLNLKMLRDPDSIPDNGRREEAEAIVLLSRSIRQERQMQPGVGYRTHGGVVRLIAGERRYWACQLAEREEMAVMVYPEKPANISLHQFVENMHRRDLDTAGVLRGLEQIMVERERMSRPITTGAQLCELVNFDKTPGYRWWAVLTGPEDVRRAIHDGRVDNPTNARDIAKLPEHLRVQVLQANDVGQALARAQAQLKANESTDKRQSRGGRKATTVKMGTTKDTNVVRHIMGCVETSQDLSHIDWNDPAQVTQAWKKFVAEVKKSLGPDNA